MSKLSYQITATHSNDRQCCLIAIWLGKQELRASKYFGNYIPVLYISWNNSQEAKNVFCKIISKLYMLSFKISGGGSDGDNAVTM